MAGAGGSPAPTLSPATAWLPRLQPIGPIWDNEPDLFL